MIGLGTIINTIAVIFGGLLGIVIKKGITKRFETIMMQANGLAVIFIGISGVLKYMLVVENNFISTQGTMLMIFSLVIGSLVGEWINIEDKMEHIGEKIKNAVYSTTSCIDTFINILNNIVSRRQKGRSFLRPFYHLFHL